MMQIKKIFMLGFGLILIFSACQHEPFPAPPKTMNPVDTTTNPIDTTTNPTDTVKPCHPDTVYYSRDIQPILTANCAYSGCHGQGSAQDGVSLINYQSVMSTADVRPNDPDGSDLYEVITETDPDKRMPEPPNPPLDASEINLIKKWILQGAKDLNCDECDTTNLSYSGNISAIFDQNCTNCHGANNPSAGRSLTTYQQVKDALLNTNLLQRINDAPGTNVMPQGGKMPDCNIDKIEAWFNAGMPQ